MVKFKSLSRPHSSNPIIRCWTPSNHFPASRTPPSCTTPLYRSLLFLPPLLFIVCPARQCHCHLNGSSSVAHSNTHLTLSCFSPRGIKVSGVLRRKPCSMKELCDNMRFTQDCADRNLHKDPRVYKLPAEIIPNPVRNYCLFDDMNDGNVHAYVLSSVSVN